MKLIYLPLEPYIERYTYLMSKRNGWAENHFQRNDLTYLRIEGEETSGKINSGSVVDAYSRSRWAMEQTKKVINLIESGEIKDGDVIYTEDFWHPGIESLFYIRDITKVDFKVGCFMHAQSIDESDFTYPMRHWIGDIEKGYSNGYDYIFVTSSILKDIAIEAGWNKDRIFLTGLPYNLNEVEKRYQEFLTLKKEPFVLFSSRFDLEKNPHFFMDLVEGCPEINFKLVKPRKHLSNSQEVNQRAERLDTTLSNFEIVDTSSKEKYYNLLARADVQFNCAIQDWVSWTLLEAVTFGCKPLYPTWKDFPYELDGFEDCLYENKNLISAKMKLRNLMGKTFDKNLKSIAQRHDKSWDKKLSYMGLI